MISNILEVAILLPLLGQTAILGVWFVRRPSDAKARMYRHRFLWLTGLIYVLAVSLAVAGNVNGAALYAVWTLLATVTALQMMGFDKPPAEQPEQPAGLTGDTIPTEVVTGFDKDGNPVTESLDKLLRREQP